MGNGFEQQSNEAAKTGICHRDTGAQRGRLLVTDGRGLLGKHSKFNAEHSINQLIKTKCEPHLPYADFEQQRNEATKTVICHRDTENTEWEFINHGWTRINTEVLTANQTNYANGIKEVLDTNITNLRELIFQTRMGNDFKWWDAVERILTNARRQRAAEMMGAR